jgi:hypothetical protein
MSLAASNAQMMGAAARSMANNGQPYSMGPGESYAFQYGQALTTDPSTCTRAPYTQWYMTPGECMANKTSSTECNPRYINGVWTYYHPFALDSKACNGILPPDVLPQMLGNTSEVQGNLGSDVIKTALNLMVNGNIGEFYLTRRDVDGAVRTYKTIFTQADQIQDELFAPLLYRYSVISQELGEKVILELNTSNGYATVLFGAEGNAPGVLQYVMTNIPPVLPGAVQSMQARQLSQARFRRA